MSDRVVLHNWRRFPRAHLSCKVTYGDRFQSWHSYTRDISLGGCRVAGYYPFPIGKSLALKITHPSTPEPVAMIGKVARLYGGADNAVGMVFDKEWRGTDKFEQWIRKVIARNPNAERTISQMPDRLPIEARLRRAPHPHLDRQLSNGEIELMQRLDKSARAVSLMELRTEWGDDWERRAQVVFELIADRILLCAIPTQSTFSSTDSGGFSVDSFFKVSAKLMKDLESEYGPIDKGFARELEMITQEVIGSGTGARTQPKQTASSSSPLDKAVRISWVSTKR
ncbi:MAG TPA: PilZ domain-containing protein [Myxococcaceae bacterium]|nr:PilZ domain-containing protein [Myxococcaceae bacterium]